MADEYNINKETIARIMLKAFNKDCNNKHYLIDLLLHSLGGDRVSQFVKVMTMDGKPRLPAIGDIIQYKPQSYDSFAYNADILKDHNALIANDNGHSLFGIIIGSDDYGSEFNPWHYKMEVNLIVNNNEKNLGVYKHVIRTEELVYVTYKEFEERARKLFNLIYNNEEDKLPF